MSFESLTTFDKNSLRTWAKSQELELVSFNHQSFLKFIQTWASPGEIWGCFQSIQNEPNMDWTLLSDFGLKLCFPKITDKGLVFISSNTFKSGIFGINEPEGDVVVPSEDLKGLFIPGLAFDHRGGRLGRGKAYYDTYLKNFSGLKVGLTWKQFFIPGSIPMEKWDEPMDFVLTESFIYQPIVSLRNYQETLHK